MRPQGLLLALLLGMACTAGENAAPRNVSPQQDFGKHTTLLSLPGWHNEGALPLGAPQVVSATAGWAYHAWSLELEEPADVLLAAEGESVAIQVLERNSDAWELVSRQGGRDEFDQRLAPGQYIVVLQTQGDREGVTTLSSACYGGGCF